MAAWGAHTLCVELPRIVCTGDLMTQSLSDAPPPVCACGNEQDERKLSPSPLLGHLVPTLGPAMKISAWESHLA